MHRTLQGVPGYVAEDGNCHEPGRGPVLGVRDCLSYGGRRTMDRAGSRACGGTQL